MVAWLSGAARQALAHARQGPPIMHAPCASPPMPCLPQAYTGVECVPVGRTPCQADARGNVGSFNNGRNNWGHSNWGDNNLGERRGRAQ